VSVQCSSLLRRRVWAGCRSILVLLAAAIAVLATGGWGPARQTFTMDEPAPHVTFNSIVDNPNWGDERNFLVIRQASDDSSWGTDETYASVGDSIVSASHEGIQLSAGTDYLLTLYYTNNAAENLRNVHAKETRVRFGIPQYIPSGGHSMVSAFIDSSNATPKSVYDHVFINAPRDSGYAISYVGGSGSIFTNAFDKGQRLSDGVFGKGAYVGYDRLNGDIPPASDKCSGYVTARLRVTREMQVRQAARVVGRGSWSSTLTVSPGELVECRSEFINASAQTQRDARLVVTIPKGFMLIDNSLAIRGTPSSTDSNGLLGIFREGVWVEAFNPNATIDVRYTLKAPSDAQLKPDAGAYRSDASMKVGQWDMVASSATYVERPPWYDRLWQVLESRGIATGTLVGILSTVVGGLILLWFTTRFTRKRRMKK